MRVSVCVCMRNGMSMHVFQYIIPSSQLFLLSCVVCALACACTAQQGEACKLDWNDKIESTPFPSNIQAQHVQAHQQTDTWGQDPDHLAPHPLIGLSTL